MTAILTATHLFRDDASSVNARLTPGRPARSSRQRARRVVENDDFAAFTRRILAAHGRRIASGDVEGLADLAALQTELDTALQSAVTGLRATGFSWAEIASRLGITRQAAQQRWGT